MTEVEVYVDPSCPWAWLTSRWIKEVAPQRDLVVTWRSYCLEIRDDYGVAAAIPEEHRERAIDALYDAWGPRFFGPAHDRTDAILGACLDACDLDRAFLDAADDEKWD